MIDFLTPAQLRRRASGKWVDYDDDIVPSNPAEMDFGIAAPILAALQKTIDDQKFGYASHGEIGPEARLKAAFQNRMKEKYDWHITDETILPVSNLVQAIAAAIVAFSEKGEGVFVQVPAYPMFLAAIETTKRTAICNPMPIIDGRYCLDLKNVEKDISRNVKILLLCHPHNPTGRVFSKEELAPLAKIAKEKNLIVISDEIHSDILFDGRTHTPFVKMFPEVAEQTITLYSASKTFNIPGLACALMNFGSKELLARFEEKLPGMILGHPGITGLVSTIAAWEEGDAWANDALTVLEKNRDLFFERFAKEMPEVVAIEPEATYLAWADFSACKLPVAPSDYLRDTGRVLGGNGANFGEGYEQFIRFNFATSPEILNEKIDRIFRAIRSNQ
nr:aminotransferase class I/II-fold pyridoxal phosphate-dependent enzyme [uncultured Cohaesibacter sp.]